ncbi:DUF805 domain-containing protein [Sphingomonas koreensis]|uniref:DUF805 domain-containing protein n=1 Tax=Sphingomonas koreensis TaxID=93064 RepID=A0A430G6Z5_9SPHN|nr:DUF805 domain-containing protein [Sphingomonas koreensis]RSY88728.1 DUF805 domain-containing protein [Sphingomonas koreensis]
MEWMILPFKRYFDFKGRSRRKEYWMYTLFVVIVSFVLAFLDSMLGLGGSATGDADLTGTSVGASGAMSGGLLSNIFSLATIIPSLAVGVRRLHDTDRSGWWILLPLGPILIGAVLMGASLMTAMSGGGSAGFSGIALFGMIMLLGGLACAILLLVWYCTPGTAGPNRFGEDPKGQGTNADEVFG